MVEPGVVQRLGLAAGQARRAHAMRAWGHAKDLVAQLQPGGAVFAVSASQFSAIDVLVAVLERIGPAKLDLWTYTPGQVEAEALGVLLDEQRITSLRLVLDQSGMHTRGLELYRSIQARFGADCLRVTKAHAKLAALTNAEWSVLIDGSANLAKNLRFEQVNIRDDDKITGLVRELTDAVFATPAPDLDDFTGAAARKIVRKVAGARPARRGRGGDGFGGGDFGGGF